MEMLLLCFDFRQLNMWFESTLSFSKGFILLTHSKNSIVGVSQAYLLFIIILPVFNCLYTCNTYSEIFRSVALRLPEIFFHFHNGDTRSAQYITSALRCDYEFYSYSACTLSFDTGTLTLCSYCLKADPIWFKVSLSGT